MSLSKTTRSLDCLDADIDGLNEIKKLFPSGNVYCDRSSIPRHHHYDLVLIPEVIEHVPNIELFITDMASLNFNTMIITAPVPNPTNFQLKGDQFFEIVHPDHKTWFSPYTLVNIIEQYTDLNVEKVFYWPHQMSCAVQIKKRLLKDKKY
jgi:hypothetical protein